MASKKKAGDRPGRSAKKSLGNAKKEAAEDREPTCFVMMPLRPPFDRYFEEIYVPAIEKAGLTAKLADSVYTPAPIIRNIVDMIREAEIVVAEMTGRNPNVMYELGVAHALGTPAILLAETIDDVPFDLRHLRAFDYDRFDPSWGDKLREKIARAAKEILADPEDALPVEFRHVTDDGAGEITATEALQERVEALEGRLRSLATRSVVERARSSALPTRSAFPRTIVTPRTCSRCGLMSSSIALPSGWCLECQALHDDDG